MTTYTGERRDWLLTAPLAALMRAAADLRDQGHGSNISYSRKVFIPLTKLCRDVCHYCTFAKAPRAEERPYLLPERVQDIARRGQAAGCTEALFTLGDKPELRYRAAREALAALGYDTTTGYLRAMCELVLKETSLLPHANPGTMTREEIASLREVSVSQGMMLESTSERLCQTREVGGTLMNESISRAAGTQHSQELPPEAMEALIRSRSSRPARRS